MHRLRRLWHEIAWVKELVLETIQEKTDQSLMNNLNVQ